LFETVCYHSLSFQNFRNFPFLFLVVHVKVVPLLGSDQLQIPFAKISMGLRQKLVALDHIIRYREGKAKMLYSCSGA
jgi:hypothetical protein